METYRFDACIIGGGTAGMAAAYALKERGYSILIVEKQPELGGTATQAWVETWIEGINPPYFVELFNALKKDGKASGNIDKSWLSNIYQKDSNGLVLDARALSRKYREDIDKDAKVTVRTGFSFKEAMINDRRVEAIVIGNGSEELKIEARYFIDSSGDGVLCTFHGKEGEDYFVGEDPYERFQESLMTKSAVRSVNEPSLFFKVKEVNGYDDEQLLLPAKETVYSSADINQETIKPKYVKNDGYIGSRWVNPMNGMGLNGMDLITMGYEHVYNQAKDLRQYEYWKYIKLELNRLSQSGKKEDEKWGGFKISQRNCSHTGVCAPMLGVRETYRIHCDRMLNQQDLEIEISSENLGRNITCGSHNLDFHVYGSISSKDVKAFNEKIRPSGISYESLIPRRFDNVLIACRAYGASHIALAARRTNKDMAQLGWAAGHAIRICMEDQLDNVRKVCVKKLQTADYTDFENSVNELEKYLKK